eukprot:jgi/Bigna1/130471/aug1.11_g5179
MDGLAGTVDGSFFKAPKWVDQNKPPGATSQAKELEKVPRWGEILTGYEFIFSPNLVWLAFAVFDHWVFPYDLEAAKQYEWGWVLERFLVNTVMCALYYGYWHFVLYGLGWGKRPFMANRQYRFSKLLHNMWFTWLGAAQWTLWEIGFSHCYATGRLPHTPMASWSLPDYAWCVACVILVPLYREVHFYVVHRFEHIRCVYRWIHSLHHRNTDIEPFAGLCMHPIEHLYYYSCFMTVLYLPAAPVFYFKWSGVHAMISPGASHSGYEDHWQSDQYHYLHHKFFECNYGTNGLPLDHWFGTFRDSIEQTGSTTYKGAATIDKLDNKKVASLDKKATLMGMSDTGTIIYYFATAIIFGLAIAAAIEIEGVNRLALPGLSHPQTIAAIVAFGPYIFGVILTIYMTRNALSRPKYTLLFPFHKEKLLGQFGFHLLAGILFTSIPVYHAMSTILSDPGESIYFSIYGKFAAFGVNLIETDM